MSPYTISRTTVVSFSGGRTSAYMLRQVLDNNDDLNDLVVTFANTGKEHPNDPWRSVDRLAEAA